MEMFDFLKVLIDRFDSNEEYVWNALNHYYKDEKFRPLIFQWVFDTLEEAITKGIRKKKERIQYMFYYLDESLLRAEKVQQELMRGAKEGKTIQVRQICIGILLRINPEAEELYEMIRELEKRFVKYALAHPEEMILLANPRDPEWYCQTK